MNAHYKRLYFKRALRKAKRRAPKRLKKLLYPERIEARYVRELDSILAFAKAKVDAHIKPLIPGLLAHYGRVRKDVDMQLAPEKYYAAFIYDKVDPDVLHCTHHYLGELTKGDALRVEKIIDAFFLTKRELPRACFDRRQHFGPDQDIPVLTSVDFKEGDFAKLRNTLEDFRESDYDEYRTHVTTNRKKVDQPFVAYALISKRGVIRTWPKSVRLDADDLGDLADELESIRLEVSQEFTPDELKKLAQLTGRDVAEFNAAQLNGQLAGIAEIDLVGSEPWIGRELGAFVQQNVDLITSIPDEYLNQVQKMVASSVLSGTRAETIAAELEDRYDVSKSRAALIARDQVGKLNGQLTELRHRDLGIDRYRWRTSGDARVRPSHEANAKRVTEFGEGIYSWDDPPAETGHPGEDYQCRCWAEPQLKQFFEDDSEEAA